MGSSKPRSGAAITGGGTPNVSVGSTLGNFANRIKRKLREQETRDEASQRGAGARHARMLQALNTIRRALQEAGQIQLGERFQLELDVGDWEGWPRLSLILVDALLPDKHDHALIVTAHDRKELGTVELRLRSGLLLGQVQMQNEGELERIPTVLKKALRSYLDLIAEYVLNPTDPEDFKRIESELLIDPEEEELDEQAVKLRRQDVFSDDEYSVRDNSVNAVDEPGALEEVFDPGKGKE